MNRTIRTVVAVSAIALVASLASPASAESFKIGLGGGATFASGDFSKGYNTGWTATVRALWLPTFLGVRGAAYYGQHSPVDSLGGYVEKSTLYGADANGVFRLVGSGASGLYLNGGIGIRSLQLKAGGTSETRSQVSYNAGAGFSSGWFFAEANVVYFSVTGTNFLTYPVTVGIQF